MIWTLWVSFGLKTAGNTIFLDHVTCNTTKFQLVPPATTVMAFLRNRVDSLGFEANSSQRVLDTRRSGNGRSK